MAPVRARLRAVLSGALVVACLAPAAAVARSEAPVDDRRMLAVLELSGDGALTAAELSYLTDVVRAESLRMLPGYHVITRENLLEILRASRTALDECEGDCEVETGRLLGADVVASGEQIRFGRRLKVSLKLHDTTEGRLLSVAEAEAPDVDSLDKRVREAAVELFVPIARAGAGPARLAPGRRTGSDDGWSGGEAVAVVFHSEPPGAALKLNGRDLAATPHSTFLEPGVYEVELVRPYYLTETRTIEVRRGEKKQEVSIVLRPNFGEVQVDTKPSGARVTLDGVKSGRTPLRLSPVSPGPHRLVVEAERHYALEETFTIEAGEQLRFVDQINPMQGQLRILALTPSGAMAEDAEVLLDGVRIGTTPFSGNVLTGPHRVEVRGAGGGYASERIDVPHQGVVTREMTLGSSSGRPADPGGQAPRRRSGMGLVLDAGYAYSLYRPGDMSLASDTAKALIQDFEAHDIAEQVNLHGVRVSAALSIVDIVHIGLAFYYFAPKKLAAWRGGGGGHVEVRDMERWDLHVTVSGGYSFWKLRAMAEMYFGLSRVTLTSRQYPGPVGTEFDLDYTNESERIGDGSDLGDIQIGGRLALAFYPWDFVYIAPALRVGFVPGLDVGVDISVGANFDLSGD